MSYELVIFVCMVAAFMIGCFALKLPVGISMFLASIVGGLLGGHGIPLRHLVEGTFAYVDTILVIAMAMIFMKVVEYSGALDALSALIIEKFYRFPALLLCMVMLIIMFPGMITGSSSAAVLSAGYVMAPVLVSLGIPMVEAASILAMGGILGAIAPPVNLSAMILCSGVDIPYVGFELPMALLSFPLAFLFVLMLGYRFVKKLNYQVVKANLNQEARKKHGFKLYIPLLTAVMLMVLNKAVPAFPDLGMPLVFLISAIIGLFTGEKINIAKAGREAVKNGLPVLAILMGVGMLIQTMTLTGVRGFIVSTCLSLPSWMLYVAMAVSIPLFGSISSFGAVSVLGVPFLLAFLSKDQVITASAISLISLLGEMMPPTALAGLFAAQVVGVENYVTVLKKCFVPCLIIIAWGVLFILFANQIAALI